MRDTGTAYPFPIAFDTERFAPPMNAPMKRLLLAALVALTAAPALPALAQAKEAPRCERPSDRPDCPPQRDRREPHRDKGDRPAPHPDRRAERPHDWRPGESYRGPGAAVDHRRADLPAPPRGQHWIRDGERYLLVTDGGRIIRSVMARALR